MLNSVENSSTTLERPLRVSPKKLDHHLSYSLNHNQIMSVSCNHRTATPTCDVDTLVKEQEHDNISNMISSSALSVGHYTSTTTTSSDEFIIPTEETSNEQFYTYRTRLHEQQTSQLTTLQVRLYDDEHDENSDLNFYHSHKHHHLPLTPPLVLLSSPCTPLTEPTSSPTSSPPASPVTVSDVSTSITLTSNTFPSATTTSITSANDLIKNCVQNLPKIESSITSLSKVTSSNDVIVSDEPLGEFKRTRSTRCSQRFTPYGLTRHNSRTKNKPISVVDNVENETVKPSVVIATVNTHLCEILPQPPLSIDTHLANVQSAVAQREARDNAQQISQQILSVIRDNCFENLTEILQKFKPDLNVFVNGQTALHHCLLMGRDVSWCKELVMAGANPNLSNKDGWHPLHLAAFKGATETLNFLVSCNNNRRHLSTSSSFSSSSSSSTTTLSSSSSASSVSANRDTFTVQQNSHNVISATPTLPSSSSTSINSSKKTPTA